MKEITINHCDSCNFFCADEDGNFHCALYQKNWEMKEEEIDCAYPLVKAGILQGGKRAGDG